MILQHDDVGEYANCEGGNGKSASLRSAAAKKKTAVAMGLLRGAKAKQALQDADNLEAKAQYIAKAVGHAATKSKQQHTEALGMPRAQYDRVNTVVTQDKKLINSGKRFKKESERAAAAGDTERAAKYAEKSKQRFREGTKKEYMGHIVQKLNLREEGATLLRGSDGKERMVKGPGRVMNSRFVGEAIMNAPIIAAGKAERAARAAKQQAYKDRAAKGQATKRKKAGIAKAKATRAANKQKAIEQAQAQQAKAAARNAKRRESYQAKKAESLPPANKKAKAINSVKSKKAAVVEG